MTRASVERERERERERRYIMDVHNFSRRSTIVKYTLLTLAFIFVRRVIRQMLDIV